LKFSYSLGNSFKIELLSVPQYNSKDTTKENKITKYTGRLVDEYSVGSRKLRGGLVDNCEVNHLTKEPPKEPLKGGTKGGTNGRSEQTGMERRNEEKT
jgi:hypothetical protein